MAFAFPSTLGQSHQRSQPHVSEVIYRQENAFSGHQISRKPLKDDATMAFFRETTARRHRLTFRAE